MSGEERVEELQALLKGRTDEAVEAVEYHGLKIPYVRASDVSLSFSSSSFASLVASSSRVFEASEENPCLLEYTGTAGTVDALLQVLYRLRKDSTSSFSFSTISSSSSAVLLLPSPDSDAVERLVEVLTNSSVRGLRLDEDCIRRNAIDEVEALLHAAEQRDEDRALANLTFGQQQSALHIAASEGFFDLVCLLLQHGADIDAVDKNHWTPLHCAAKEHLEICQLLLERGADVSVLTDAGTSAFHYLVRAQVASSQLPLFHRVLDLVLARGQELDVQNDSGETPLHQACLHGRQEACIWLVEHGADVHVRNKNRETALHFAARHGSEDTVELLLAADADPSAEGEFGTASDVARGFGKQNIVSLIAQWEANGHCADGSDSDSEDDDQLLALMASRHSLSDASFHRRNVPNGPALTLPRQRRLRHVRSVLVRSIRTLGERRLTSCYFSLLCQDGTVAGTWQTIYRSAVKENTMNPSWTNVKLAEEGGAGAKATRFLFRLHCATDDTVVMETGVRLHRLGYVGDKLHSMTFPDNMLLLELADGYYVKEDLALFLQDAFKRRKQPVLEARKKIYTLDTLHDILDAQVALADLRNSNAARKQQVAERLEEHRQRLAKRQERDTMQKRLEKLKRLTNEYKIRLEHEREQLARTKAELVPRARQLHAGLADLVAAKADLERKQVQLEAARANLRDQWELVDFRRSVLIRQLRRLFPITQTADQKALCVYDIRLPNSDFGGCDEELVATGLGLVCHMLHLVARWFDVPLRYRLLPMASRSSIRDEISTKAHHSSKFPLYSRGVERTRFEYGVYLLNKNVEQLLNSQNLDIITLRHTLANLQLFLISCSKPAAAQPDRRKTIRAVLDRKQSLGVS